MTVNSEMSFPVGCSSWPRGTCRDFRFPSRPSKEQPHTEYVRVRIPSHRADVCATQAAQQILSQIHAQCDATVQDWQKAAGGERLFHFKVINLQCTDVSRAKSSNRWIFFYHSGKLLTYFKGALSQIFSISLNSQNVYLHCGKPKTNGTFSLTVAILVYLNC